MRAPPALERQPTFTIFQLESDDHRSHLRQLWLEHLEWVNRRCSDEYSLSFDPEEMLELNMAELAQFHPPEGRIFLSECGSQPAGCACLRRIGEGIGEVKRMFVRPEYRGQGMGRALLEEILGAADDIGYSTVRLDTAGFMKEAQTLYRSFSFREIEPYEGNEILDEYRPHWVFMEITL